MAVLETIRVKLGVFITVLIAVALLSFIVDFNSLSSAIQNSSSKYSVGEINGSKVSYKDFQEQVEYQTTIAEIINGSSASTDQQQQQIRNAAWQHFVDQNLFLKNAKAAGIEVGKDELAALTLGEEMSPVMAYDPIFGSPNGQVNVEAVRSFVANLDADASGNSRLYWDYLQNNLMTQQYYAKYGSLFTASALVNNLALANAVAENNTTYSIQSVMVPYGYQKDTTIKVTPSEVKKYYNAHKKQFKQVANRDIVYALFEVTPSAEDLDAARSAVEDVYDEFAQAANVKAFLMRNSEQPLSNYYYRAGELNSVSREVNDFVFSGRTGVSPVFTKGNEFMAVKVVETKNIPDSVFVRHILIQGDENLADSLFNVVKRNPAQFSSVAAVYSADKNPNAVNPGDIGWMTQTYMIPGMESVMTARLNVPFVLDTQYGRHIVLVTKATKPIAKKQIALLKKTAIPSKKTMNEYYGKANTLATAAAGKLENLENAAKEQGVYLRPMNVNEATARYSSIDRAKEVTRWVFEAKKGQTSNVITVNQNYLFVVGVKETHKEGYATVAEATSRIENVLYQQKLSEKVATEVAAKIEGLATIEEVAAALDQTVETKDNVAFASNMGSANDPALLGAVAGAETGKVTGPVKGAMGVYVVVVKDSNTASFYTEDDAKAFAAQIAQYNSQMLIPALLDVTGSVDNRERFY